MKQEKLQLIFNRVQSSTKEKKEIKAMYKDALDNSKEYQEVVEELRKVRDKKKKIEDGIKDDFRGEFDKLDTLKVDLENDNLLLSDAALVRLAKGETVEVFDTNGIKYIPEFKVKFKKG